MGLFDGKKGWSLGKQDKLGEALDKKFFPSTEDEDAAVYDALMKQQELLGNIQLPDLKPMDYQDYEWLGDLEAPTLEAGPDLGYENVDARLADASVAGDSRFNDIEGDPRLKDRQMAGLDALDEIVQGGGRTMADDANLNRVLNEVGAADRGRREAIKSDMQARGMGSSGMELLAALNSAEAATNRANQSGLDIAAQAQDRALEAIMSGSNMAGGIRGQDFDEEAQVAAANDAISKFNAGLTTQNNQFNAGAVNDMSQFNAGNQLSKDTYNLDKNRDIAKTNAAYAFDAAKVNQAGKQGVADANVDNANKATTYNTATMPQQKFENEVSKVTGQVGGLKDVQKYWGGESLKKDAEGRDNRQTATSAAMMVASDERCKKDVKDLSDADIDEFLLAVQPKSFRYKKPETSGTEGGDRIGFLIQDVQDTKAGKAITRKRPDGTLGYDKDNLDGVLLAALASIAKGKKAS